MTELTIYGASDDLIEVDGAISAEFDVPSHGTVLVVTDSELVEVYCDMENRGFWQSHVIVREGNPRVSKFLRFGDEDDDVGVTLGLDGGKVYIYLIHKDQIDSGRHN